MNADIGSVLREYRKKENISVKQVSNFLTSKGFRASEKTIYSWEKGGSQPSPDAFLLLCKLYNISNILDTFGYAKDKKSGFNLSIDETAHIKKYRQLDDYGKTVVDSVIDLALKRLPAEEKEDNIIRLLFSANKASAGTGYFLFDAYPDSTIDIYKLIIR